MRFLCTALLCLLFLAAPADTLRAGDKIELKVQRLSDRVLVLTEESPMKNNIVALASEKGLVVIDTSGSHATAAALRERIAAEFGRDDFAFTINTHHHWDHSWGNQVFADTVIVGHERCRIAMLRDGKSREKQAQYMANSVKEQKLKLGMLDPASDKAEGLRRKIVFSARNARCLAEGFVLTPPTMTFSDQMTLDLGDLTVNMVFFGNAHSGDDILIEIPEEGILCTGDLFLDGNWLPLFAGMKKLDVPRFIKVLEPLLSARSPVKTVIPGHQDLWSREKLTLWRDYIVQLWETIVKADAAGLPLAEIAKHCPLDKKYFYLKELGHSEEEILGFHGKNIQAFWGQLRKSAISMMLEAIEKEGLEAALKRFASMKAGKGKKGGFNESDFNSLGYELLQAGNVGGAIAVFKLNVEMYPSSWNVHDSLAEAYLEAGMKEEAIRYYRKSIELNPQNENGRAMLKKIGAE
jgi:glyoxylase-like metal-dependent hydrolase (beta-lactamase superfamily II)